MPKSNAELLREYRNRKRGGPPRKPRPCGTRAAATRHRRNGDVGPGQSLEDVCPRCAQAERDYFASRRQTS